jgi:pectate lyase
LCLIVNQKAALPKAALFLLYTFYFMKLFSFNFFLLLLCALHSCAQQKQAAAVITNEQLAFPGAEGYGKYTTGGRGGKVMIVSNLNDDGEGSFRYAVTQKFPRIVVFAVSGTIQLISPLSIKSNVTIAGQTAPGDGICIADHPVTLGGDNIIVRYLRFRMGDRYQNEGKIPGSGHDDAFGGTRRKHIIIDHCSMSWSTDEVFSVYDGDSTTLQWNIIAEPLNYSYHFEEGDTDFEKHGYGGIWGGSHLSAHHNLFAHCNNRNPRFAGTRSAPQEFVDFRNNVIYNWGGNNIYGGEGGNYNIINNYFKYGPSTSETVRSRIVNPNKEVSKQIPYGKFYVSGNFVDGFDLVTNNNSNGVHMGNSGTEIDKLAALLKEPIPAEKIQTQSAADAFSEVLKQAGASLPSRDAVDQRIVSEVTERKGRIIDVQGGFPHGTSYETSKSAWPLLQSKSAPADADKDGMADEWEKQKGLDTGTDDSALYSLSKMYTNLEIYLNELR